MTTRRANLIGGDWIEGSDWSENRNPSDTSDVVGEFAQGTAGHVDQAVQAVQLRADRIHQRGDLGVVRDVAREYPVRPALRREVRHAVLEPVALVGEGQFRALGATAPGDPVGDRTIGQQAQDENAFTRQKSRLRHVMALRK